MLKVHFVLVYVLFVRTFVSVNQSTQAQKYYKMYNTNKILRGLLEKSTVQVDLTLDSSSTEIQDTKFYLYAQLELNESGYEFDICFAEKTSYNVSAETLEIIELTEGQERVVCEHLLEAMDTAKQSEDEDEGFFDPYKEYGISNEQFINLNLNN